LWVFGLMSVCRARSLSLFGIDAFPVEVEVDVSPGLPGFSIVGLPDAAVQEARERVRVAISNSGYKFPTKKVIGNLAPSSIPISYPANGVKPPYCGVLWCQPWCHISMSLSTFACSFCACFGLVVSNAPRLLR
jgi:Subunit ChlI of Mg-chelatase